MGVRVAWRQCNTRDTVEDDHEQAQREVDRSPKIRIITIVLRRVLSEIKLKRTDTTLDLSQKAKRAKEEKEKRFKIRAGGRDYIEGCGWSVHDGKVATVDTGRKPHRLENPRVESDSRGGGAAVGCTAGAGTHARQARCTGQAAAAGSPRATGTIRIETLPSSSGSLQFNASAAASADRPPLPA